MRPSLAALAAAFVALFLIGCAGGGAAGGNAPAAASALSAVKLGMSPAEVEALAGSPSSVEPKAGERNVEVWLYQDGVIMFEDERVVFRYPEPPRKG